MSKGPGARGSMRYLKKYKSGIVGAEGVCGEIGGGGIYRRAGGWARGVEHKGDEVGEINRS